MKLTKITMGFAALILAVAVAGSVIVARDLRAQDPTPTLTAQQAVNTAIALNPTAPSEPEPVASAQYCDARSQGIAVQGLGAVSVPADVAVISLGVEVREETVGAARAGAADAMTAVIEAVKEQGVTDDDITTTEFSIWPETTWIEEDIVRGGELIGKGGRSVIIGYGVSNRVNIEIDMSDSGDGSDVDTDMLSAVIDTAATAGGDSSRVDSIYFKPNDTSIALDEARELAVADALHRANLYADALGVQVGALLNLSETSSASPYSPLLADARVGFARVESASSTPINAGESTVEARINAEFAIVNPGCSYVTGR